MTEIQNPKQKKQSKFKIRNFMILKKANQLKKIFLSILEKSSLGHWFLEFEICLGFDAWDLRFN